MNINQANTSFDKLEELVNKILSVVPVQTIEQASTIAFNLKEGMEAQIEKLENKGELTETQDDILDRFQSSIEAIANIATNLESLHDTVIEFDSIRSQIEEAKNTM